MKGKQPRKAGRNEGDLRFKAAIHRKKASSSAVVPLTNVSLAGKERRKRAVWRMGMGWFVQLEAGREQNGAQMRFPQRSYLGWTTR